MKSKVKYKKAVDQFMLSAYQKRNAWKDGYGSGISSNDAHALGCLRKLQSYQNVIYVKDVDYKYIDGFISTLIGTMSNSTINKYIVHFRRFFNFCVNWEMIYVNHANKINKLKESRAVPYSFKDEEIERILAHAGKYQNFFEFMLETGLRPTDTWELTQDNFSKDENGMSMKVRMKKCNKNITVPISKTAQQIVESSGHKLFPWASKKSCRREPILSLKRSFGDGEWGILYCKKYGITLHTFRHTYAMRLLAKGVSKDVVQQLLGHSSVRITEIYAREIPQNNLRQALFA